MVFNSFGYFIFFAIVVSAYFLMPHRFRWILLLASSYYFYMSWKVEYAVLIIASTVIAYLCGIMMTEGITKQRRKFLLVVSVSINLGILFAFKYFNFVSDSLRIILASVSVPLNTPTLRVLLPIGISFYTFQTLSYTIDVYRGKLKPEKHLGVFALYVSFFPQLVAGPIERATHLLPQIMTRKSFDIDRICAGVQLIFWGLFKKIVIADRLAIYVDTIYNNVGHHTGPSYLIATYFFAFQIYCDFSAYSDIAIGSAKVLGFDLMENFRRPYFATTSVDFWRRWHISLSTWLRDYLYIPLGGNRRGVNRTHINLMITMILGGLWHGANWTFIMWGLLHGVLLIASKLTLATRDMFYKKLRVPPVIVKIIRVFVTFHLVCFCWIFFRANTITDAFDIIANLFSGWPTIKFDQMVFGYGIPAIMVLLIVQMLQSTGKIQPALQRSPVFVRWPVYCLVLFSIILFGVESGSQFIYFQF